MTYVNDCLHDLDHAVFLRMLSNILKNFIALDTFKAWVVFNAIGRYDKASWGISCKKYGGQIKPPRIHGGRISCWPSANNCKIVYKSTHKKINAAILPVIARCRNVYSMPK